MNDFDVTQKAAQQASANTQRVPRRSFLSHLTGLTMAGGLLASYGTLTVFAGRYLYPARPRREAWLYAAEIKQLRVGDAFDYTAPTGEKIVIARHAATDEAGSFIALSSTCPHLGCQVHWEAANDRFFCPCHNGVFSPDGTALEGPPAQAGTDLSRYELRLEDGLLYIRVPTERLGDGPMHKKQVALTIDGRCVASRVHAPAKHGHRPGLERA